MAKISRQIGWNQEEIILNEILKQLQKLTMVVNQLTVTTTTTAIP